MPKYMIQASYTAEGTQGLLKDGGTKRRAVVEEISKSLGGKLESFYYAFGPDDVFALVEMPDHATVAAFALAVNATGAVRIKTSVLMTPEEIDQAAKKTVGYRAPGR